METLHIEASKQTPEIYFDGKEGILNISGKSYPENVNIFYKQLFDYIEEYNVTPASKTKIRFNWLYYNTATNKIIVKTIMLLKRSATKLEIDWYYNEGFEMIMEKGNEIKEILNIDMNVIQQ